jgi:hypothetical protein
MDLIDTLRKKIVVLDEGDYIPGLKAVLLHIETAFRHLSRGQESDDDTAFTDAIYRTNQAFEGSVKEAYRVLADQDPAKKRPYDIESYLEQKNTFRSRVLSQLTTYRTQWRNPSTHDYKLDFDESEAFLAIVSVSAFACLLLDQIAERLAFKRSQAEAEGQKAQLAVSLAQTMDADLLVRVTDLLTQFCAIHMPAVAASSGKLTESQVIGALHGFLASAAPELNVQTEALLDKTKPFRADLLVARGDDRLVIELKRRLMPQSYGNAIAQVEQYLFIGGVKSGILLFLPDAPSQMERIDTTVGGIDARLVILAPMGSSPSLNRLAASIRSSDAG